jgi:hypothetical protein
MLSSCKNIDTSKELIVENWNNFYEGTNIHFYYEDFKNTNIEELNRSYQLNGKIGNSGEELERAVKLTQWMKTLMEYDKGSISTKEDALSILKERETSKKASDREYSIVFSQSATSLGIFARRGEFRAKEATTNKGEAYHKVVEIWSDKFNKWIMIDPIYGAYFKKGDTPLSAMEIVQSGLDNLEMIGADAPDKYTEMLKKVIYSYSISIDNSIYGKKRSNTYITYLKPEEIPQLKLPQGYIPPTIFVNNQELFNISPKNEYTDDKSDKIPTLVIMKKTLEDSGNSDKTFVIGVFMNSVMLQNYKLKINEEPWKNVELYSDIVLIKGRNSISLSLNGEDVIREIVIMDNR